MTSPTTAYSTTSLVGELKCPPSKTGDTSFHQHTQATCKTQASQMTSTTMAISALLLLSSAAAAPLSPFAPPLTFTCSQTRQLHAKMSSSAKGDSGAKKSMHNEHNKFSHLRLAATALLQMRHRRLLQRPQPSRPFFTSIRTVWRGGVAAVEAAATKPITLRPPNFYD